MWQNSKIQNATTQKLKMWQIKMWQNSTTQNLTTQNVTELKSSKRQFSKTINVTKLEKNHKVTQLKTENVTTNRSLLRRLQAQTRSYETREQTSAAPRLRLNTSKLSRLRATLDANVLLQCLLLSSTHGFIVLSSININLFTRFKHNLRLNWIFQQAAIHAFYQAFAATNCLLPGSYRFPRTGGADPYRWNSTNRLNIPLH